MNYQNHYDLLITRGQSRILESYSERHHIIPSCLGGDNSDENLVRLTPEEHYLAHQLLVKIYPGNHKLIYAANMMANTRSGNKQYGWLRRKHSIAISETLTGRTKENDPVVKARSEKMTGRTKETHNGVRRVTEQLKGRTKETHEYIRLQSDRISKTMTGRTKENHDGNKRQSEKMTGRTKETCPGVRAISEKLTGRTKGTCPGVKARSEKLRKLTDEQEQILFNMRENKITGTIIQEYLKSIGVIVADSSISAIYNRIKREKTK